MVNGLPQGNWLKAELGDDGFRMTKVRKGLIELLSQYRYPLTFDEIRGKLARRGIEGHRATLYRELEFLLKEEALQLVIFEDGVRRYELLDRAHHHHVVCVKCDAIEEVQLDHELEQEEKRIAKKTKFEILRHSLEFFGLCANCK